MTLDAAQQAVRTVFLGGSVGQMVTGVIWLLSAALGTFGGETYGILGLFFGGMLIFPLTQLVLRLLGHRAALGPTNPLARFPLQSVAAMTALYPLVYAATIHNVAWFYPAFMMVVGAHYVSFILLYGMWQYGALAAALVGGGIALAVLLPHTFSLGGWLTGIVLLGFAFFVWQTIVARQPSTASQL